VEVISYIAAHQFLSIMDRMGMKLVRFGDAETRLGQL
jgi:hypothetical protein